MQGGRRAFMDLIAALATFARVAETGSFSAAARERGATQSAVSRQITALESDLGVRLFQRTTRRLALTEDGQEALANARLVLEAVAATRNAAARRSGEASGMVRLAAPVLIGNLVATRMPELLARHPALSVHLVIGRTTHDLVEEGLDLWLRLGESTHATEVTRTLGRVERLVLAAPSYLAARGRPAHPRDLMAHDCVAVPVSGADRTWHFTGPDGEDLAVPVASRFTTDSGEAVLRAALAGAGIALAAEVAVRADVAAGRLVPLLTAFPPEPLAVTLVYPSRRNLAPRVRAVIDFLARDILGRPDPFGAGNGETPGRL
jgi:DNA-binding transcriptional LysR family regulator